MSNRVEKIAYAILTNVLPHLTSKKVQVFFKGSYARKAQTSDEFIKVYYEPAKTALMIIGTVPIYSTVKAAVKVLFCEKEGYIEVSGLTEEEKKQLLQTGVCDYQPLSEKVNEVVQVIKEKVLPDYYDDAIQTFFCTGVFGDQTEEIYSKEFKDQTKVKVLYSRFNFIEVLGLSQQEQKELMLTDICY